MTVTLDLLDVDGSFVKALDGYSGAGWVHPRRGAGRGSLVVRNDHPDRDALSYWRIIRCNIDGAPSGFGWLLHDDPYVRLASEGRQGEVTLLSGAGALALLGMGQWGGATIVSTSADGLKSYGWMGFGYTDANLAAAVQFGTHETPNVEALEGAAEGFPDGKAGWISSRALDGNDRHPVGEIHLRGLWDTNVPASGRVRVFWTADNWGELWTNGGDVRSTSETDRYAWRRYDEFDLEVDGSDVQFAARVVNDPPTTGANPCGLLLTVVALDGDGVPTHVLYRSDATWEALDFDVAPQGINAGHVIVAELAEAQARGALDGIVTDITDALDSDAGAWDVWLPAVSFRDGELLGDVVLQMSQTFRVDAQMHVGAGTSNTLTLKVYNSLGSDLTATVELEDGTADAADAKVDARGPRGNAVRVETDGGFGWAEDSAAIAAVGRRELSATLGKAGSLAEVVEAMDEFLDELQGRRTQVVTSAGISARPYDDYTVGDSVSVTDRDGASPYRVEVLSVTDLPASEVLFEVDVERRL